MAKLKVIGIIIGSLLLVMGAGVLWLDWFERKLIAGLCGNEILHQSYSPDGQYKVIVFERDCGATTGLSTQASILPKRKSLSDSDAGNALICDDDGRKNVRVEWESNRKLRLLYNSRACNFLPEIEQTGISITRVNDP